MEIALGIVMLVLALVLVLAVMMQSGKDKQLSGSITGVSESFLGKNRAKKADKMWSMVTIIGGILFVVLDVVMYLFVING
ncbi:MAG: preprotein translocase subunit SecG [Clostridia bacterium]|nr:preprotein translocase subunit SecG [Clostridia bacterium]